VSASANRRKVVRSDGHAHHKGAAGFGVVGIEVGKVGEVDSGRVIDALQGTGSVEVANGSGRRLGLLLSGGRAFGLLDGGAEGAGTCDLVGGEAGDELVIR
jgi:hypothetical protein